MPFPSALVSGQYDSLRGTSSVPPTYQASQYMVLGDNVTVFQARVNQATFGDSYAQTGWDTATIGAYTDVKAGQTVFISSTTTLRNAQFVGRVRKVPNATTFFINETSSLILDNWYITVIDDYRLWVKLGRETGGVYYKDWETTFVQPAPLVYGLASAYAGVVSGLPVGYTVAFAASAIAVASGATISSYAWSTPDGTVTAGSLSAAGVTIRFPAGFRWVSLTVTDSGGRAQTRRIPVWAIPSDLSTTVALGFDGANIEGSIDGGYSASVRAFTGVDTLLDNTVCAIVNVERYNGTEGSLVSNIAFTGRIRTEGNRSDADDLYSTLSEISYDIEGVGAQLARVSAPSIYMRSKASATVWDELVALTFWRAMWYLLFHSTFHELHSLAFDETGTTYRYLQLQTQGGNLLDAITDLAQSVTATFEFAPQGDSRVYRNLNYLETAGRNAAPTVAAFEERDWLALSLNHEQIETVGAVGGDGGSYNTSTNYVVALLGNAPKVAQGNAEGTSTLSRQVLTANLSKAAAKLELSQRLGHHYAFANPNDTLDVTFPDGYHWLTPSYSQWYTFAIGAGVLTSGRTYTAADRWTCQTVSIEHDNATGTKRVQASFRLESEGTPGTAYEPPAPVQIGLNLPAIPPFPPFPPLGTPPDVYLPPNPDIDDVPPVITPGAYVAKDGNAVLVTTANGVWVCTDFLTSSTPTWREVTPAVTGSITAAVFGAVQSAYVLESDGDISVLWYTGDVFASDPTWTEGFTLTGDYFIIRPTSTIGGVYIRGTIITEGGCFGAPSGVTDIYAQTPVVTPRPDIGAGWYETTPLYSETAFEGNGAYFATILMDSCCKMEEVDDNGNTAAPGGNQAWYDCALGGPNFGSFGQGNCVGQVTFRYFFGTPILFQLVDDPTCTGGGTRGVVRHSPDFGASWSAEYYPALGGGIDTIKIGDGALIGNATTVQLADADDVGFVNYGGTIPVGAAPTAIFIPRLTFAGGSNINTDTPVYLLASADVTAGNLSIWKVTASGVTFTDITFSVGADEFEAVSEECIHMPWSSASRMAAIGMFGATVRLITSTSAGAVWSNRGALDATARYVRFRKGNTAGRQIYFTNGAPGYSPDFGANLYLKSHPDPLGTTVAPLRSIEPFG